ncbi:hypothetical protein WG68_10390 [Arsukibacterium ikkense]|uniref:Lcl C-terminal domain-containing protein n=1 Tax=Arsukibacterium ikkense TaxID=336831 RepID=A0A0M2V3U3_9GAMM|nr:hypothetical protein WG68_10390 [Arsukibacterium ikkense]
MKELIGGRYLVNNDGTVTDIQTNITWQRCSVGQTWTGETCAGEATRFKWYDAIQLSKDGWRLPTVDELDTLVFCGSGHRMPSIRPNGQFVSEANGFCKGDYVRPTINQLYFPNTPENAFWSSTPGPYGSDGGWYVGFGSGVVVYGASYFNYKVRLVRAEQ